MTIEQQLLTDKAVLIMGSGAVGVRNARLLLSLGVPVHFYVPEVKREEEKEGRGRNRLDIETGELSNLLSQYAGTPIGQRIKVFAALGDNPAQRKRQLQEALGMCHGSIADIGYQEAGLVIDCMAGEKKEDWVNLYKKWGLPFALHGDCKQPELVDGRFFVSTPQSSVTGRESEYVDNDTMLGSSNTTCVSTAIGLFMEAVGGEKPFKDTVRDLDVFYLLRAEDPHGGIDQAKRLTSAVITHKPYHVAELEYLYPALRGRITTKVMVIPTQYFHQVEMTFNLAGAYAILAMDKLKEHFQFYSRCIVVDGNELDHQKIMNAAAWAGIPDGDVPVPVYLLLRPDLYTITISALTPQRGITAPSTADYVLFRLLHEQFPTLEAAGKHVNERARWQNGSQDDQGHERRLVSLVHAIERNLSNYDRLKGERGEQSFAIWRTDAV